MKPNIQRTHVFQFEYCNHANEYYDVNYL